jgi:hypothetical protein
MPKAPLFPPLSLTPLTGLEPQRFPHLDTNSKSSSISVSPRNTLLKPLVLIMKPRQRETARSTSPLRGRRLGWRQFNLSRLARRVGGLHSHEPRYLNTSSGKWPCAATIRATVRPLMCVRYGGPLIYPSLLRMISVSIECPLGVQ